MDQGDRPANQPSQSRREGRGDENIDAHLPSHQLWIDYDAEGDVLYLSFEKPQQATDSVMAEDGNVYHYRGERLVGVTILHASKRAQEAAG
jgi:uncharacterized protein YuzE